MQEIYIREKQQLKDVRKVKKSLKKDNWKYSEPINYNVQDALKKLNRPIGKKILE